MYQNNQQFQNQSNKYQPVGFVQSQYQGIPKSRGGISAQNAGPVISHVGYSAAQSNQNGLFQQQMRSSSQGGGSGFGINASVGPVISRVGYSNGQDFYAPQASGQQQQQQMQASMSQQQQQPIISKFGYTAGQNSSASSSSRMGQQAFQGASSFSSQAQSQFHPVYQATGQAQQAGPVISHVGGYSVGGQTQSGQRF